MSKKRRRNRDRYDSGGNRDKFQSRKRAGWGMNLYRNTRDGKIAGICAGLADYWDIAPWVMRLMWVTAFLFTGTLALWVYLAGWILLSPRPSRWTAAGGEDAAMRYGEAAVEMEYDERYHDYRPRKVFRYTDSSSVRLKRARERLDAALNRVQAMESYVTSRQYELNKEFSKL